VGGGWWMVDLIGGIFQVARQELENTESARGVKSASSSESVNPAGYWVAIHRTVPQMRTCQQNCTDQSVMRV
jgi:hypothetical protein